MSGNETRTGFLTTVLNGFHSSVRCHVGLHGVHPDDFYLSLPTPPSDFLTDNLWYE